MFHTCVLRVVSHVLVLAPTCCVLAATCCVSHVRVTCWVSWGVSSQVFVRVERVGRAGGINGLCLG